MSLMARENLSSCFPFLKVVLDILRPTTAVSLFLILSQWCYQHYQQCNYLIRSLSLFCS